MTRIQKYLDSISDWEVRDETSMLRFTIYVDDWELLKPEIEDLYNIEEEHGYHMLISLTKKRFLLTH